MNKQTENKDKKMEEIKTTKQCGVCYDDLTVDNCVSTPCKHSFCSKCFFKWLKESNTCPLCRNNYTRYHKWDYDDIDMNAVTHEFNMFRDVISRTKDALSEHHIKKEKLEKRIEQMNKAIDVNNQYIVQKQQSCLRMNKDLEYKRGFYKASHFPITEIDLYNFKHDDQETVEWKKGFQSGFEKKYDCNILNDYDYVIDPFISKARNVLNILAKEKENGISVEKFDKVKNDIYKLVHCLSRRLTKKKFKELFNSGILKNKDGTETIIGMPFKMFESAAKNTYIVCKEIYVDFIYDKNEGSWYKTPYYINDNNDMCYFDYEVKLNKKDNDSQFKFNRKRKHMDISNNLNDIVNNTVNEIIENVVSKTNE